LWSQKGSPLGFWSESKQATDNAPSNSPTSPTRKKAKMNKFADTISLQPAQSLSIPTKTSSPQPWFPGQPGQQQRQNTVITTNLAPIWKLKPSPCPFPGQRVAQERLQGHQQRLKWALLEKNRKKFEIFASNSSILGLLAVAQRRKITAKSGLRESRQAAELGRDRVFRRRRDSRTLG
jgi:hypothetical protein